MLSFLSYLPSTLLAFLSYLPSTLLSFLSYLPSPYFNCPLLFTVHSLYYMYEFPLICTSLLLFFLHLLFFLSYCITFPLYSTFPPLIYLHYKFSFIQIHSPLFANLLHNIVSLNVRKSNLSTEMKHMRKTKKFSYLNNWNKNKRTKLQKMKVIMKNLKHQIPVSKENKLE